MNIQIKLLTSEAKLPTRGSDFAAGYDLYTIEHYELKPGERHLYKTGISTAMPNNIYGRIAPRSGYAYKNGIDVMAGVIDPDYRGEIGVLLVNLGQEPVQLPVVKDGKELPVAQMIFTIFNEVSFLVEDVLPESKRDEGGFGHTDNKKPQPLDPRKAPIKTSVNIIERWKEAGDDVPVPQKYESVAREREKLIS